ncbi:MAG: hypothetical protein KJO11_16935 [Gemmatimonadetes bacterium]|nr:hypothetical protein [Gemmatimonadota bacterium]NNK62271.1 hypothetical protein [Gemmatimonadota bacterium]
MTLHVPIHPEGTRIEIRRGRMPLDSALVGRTGTVVELSDYRPGRYGVVLDGEEQIREFREDELHRIAD